jgi:RNA polymerase sigma factor (sigma-70 family)
MKSTAMHAPAPAGIMTGEQAAMLNEAAGDQSSRNESAETAENERLVRRCIQGDQQAWEHLIGKYKRLILSIPMATYGAHAEDAADVFQAVCIEALNSLPQLRNVQSLRAWLITVTLRQSYRWKKKQANHVELDAMESQAIESIPDTSLAKTLEELEQARIVREVVAQLSPQQRELVRLLFFVQPPVPYVDVARRLGLATGSIGFIRARCLAKLRKALMASGID